MICIIIEALLITLFHAVYKIGEGTVQTNSFFPVNKVKA